MAAQLEILIEGAPLDLPPGEKDRFYITKQINDVVKGLKTREGDFTRDIAFPRTANNIDLLNVSFQGVDRTPSNFIPCSVLMGGVNVINEGLLAVIQTAPGVISATIFAGNTNFFSQLKEADLTELDLADYDFTWDLAGVAALRNSSAGVVTANSIFTDNVSLRQFVALEGDPVEMNLNRNNLQWGGFWFYIHTILEVIFDQLEGLTVDVTGLKPEFFENALAIPLPFLLEAYDNPPGYRSRGLDDTAVSYPIFTDTVMIPTIFDDDDLLWSAIDQAWKLKEAGLVLIRLSISGGGSTPDISIRPIMHIKVNGVIVESIHLNVGWNFFTTFSAAITGSAPGEIDDLIQATIEVPNASNVQSFAFNFSIERAGASPDRDLTIAEHMPQIDQKKFVLNIMNWFNIVATEVDRVVTLSYWDDIPTRPAILKTAANLNINSRSLLPSYGELNFLKYADNDFVERLDTSANFPVFSNILDPEKIIIEVIFSASDQYDGPDVIDGVVALPHFGYNYENVDNNKIQTDAAGNYSTIDANSLSAGDVIRLEGQPINYQVATVINSREGTLITPAGLHNALDWQFLSFSDNRDNGVHVARMIEVPNDIIYVDGAEVGPSQPGPHKIAEFSPNLLFINILNEFFANLTRALAYPEVITIWVNLSLLEFSTMDQTRPIYIDHLAQKFYINKIEQFKIEGLARLELLRI